MRIRVVGSSSAVPRPGSACSCYLVETPQTSVILDCGSGSLQSLERFIDPALLSAVIVSHFHADHVFDLVPLRYLRAFLPARKRTLLDVHIPPGGTERARCLALAAHSSEAERFFERSMRLREYDAANALEIQDLRITFVQTEHYIEAYAMRVTDGATSAVYSADTAPCAQVVRLARGADLFVCECALGPDGTEGTPRGHCSAREAGRMARDAGVKHLLLTHYGQESEPASLALAASREFDGAISVAEDGWEMAM